MRSTSGTDSSEPILTVCQRDGYPFVSPSQLASGASVEGPFSNLPYFGTLSCTVNVTDTSSVRPCRSAAYQQITYQHSDSLSDQVQ